MVQSAKKYCGSDSPAAEEQKVEVEYVQTFIVVDWKILSLNSNKILDILCF